MRMAIAVVFDAPGMTAAQYDEITQNLDAAGEAKPDGRLYHVSAPTETGWLVVDVWESEEKLARFTETLIPLIQQAGTEPPQPRVYPVHRIMIP
jgi:hypothetical protein